MKYTIAEALQEMRRLHRVDAGHLRGVQVRYHLDELTGLDRLPEPWGSRLVALIEACKAGTITADTPYYLVYSGGMPVAWATVHAAVITPQVPMSPLQAKHQRQVASVLADLDRDVLEALADQRDQREARPDSTNAHSDDAMLGALRVAPMSDPTATRWVRVGADVHAARDTVSRAVGGRADQALIVAAVGYGHHGYHAHRLSLDLICAIQAVAAAHPVSLSTVGDWIDHDHGLAGRVDPGTLAARFADAYVGRYPSTSHYARHVMDRQNWSEVLRAAGIVRYFDLHRYERDLFTAGVFAISLELGRPGGPIEVFHRPATSWPPAPLDASRSAVAAVSQSRTPPVARRQAGRDDPHRA